MRRVFQHSKQGKHCKPSLGSLESLGSLNPVSVTDYLRESGEAGGRGCGVGVAVGVAVAEWFADIFHGRGFHRLEYV